MLSKLQLPSKVHPSIASTATLTHISTRNVHWYHNWNMAGANKDAYELYNRKPEFGQGEIGDKDRYPHLYWNLNKGRNTIQRVTHQWGYHKDVKPEKVRRDLEKFAYFQKLDALHFLELERHHYSFLDNDAKNSIGYISEDEDDELTSHPEYGQTYKDASSEYRQLVLEDQCDGRPAYEWQIPSRLDMAYGYSNVSTAVDILGRESNLENLQMDWTVEASADKNKGLFLRNQNTMTQLCLIDQHSAANVIGTFEPNTIVLQCGAETLLSSVQSKYSPTSKTDLMGCCISMSWSVLYFISEYFPTSPLAATVMLASLLGINSTFLYRTFSARQRQDLKSIFELSRKLNVELVLADWLRDDYDERLNQIRPFDMISRQQESSDSELVVSEADGDGNIKKTFQQLMKIAERYNEEKQDDLKIEELGTANWMNTFRDAVNSRRLDLLAHVLNNCEGERILMCIDEMDNISTGLVTELLVQRLTSQVKIEKAPLLFDGYYERVQVQF